jgi:hypothetical protein
MGRRKKTPHEKEAEASEGLQQAKARLLDVQTRGDAAISSYDLTMGYDADFYLHTVPLLQHHVDYYEKELKAARQARSA